MGILKIYCLLFKSYFYIFIFDKSKIITKTNDFYLFLCHLCFYIAAPVNHSMPSNLTTIAYKLNVSVAAYVGIEKGEILLTHEQAECLAKIYNTHSYYFYNEAQQLDLLLTGIEIIKDLELKIDLLQEKLKTMNVPVL